MTKKKVTIDRIWLVIVEETIQWTYASRKEAEDTAKDLVEDGHTDVKIYEVCAAWGVEYPQEPEPEIFEMSLGSI